MAVLSGGVGGGGGVVMGAVLLLLFFLCFAMQKIGLLRMFLAYCENHTGHDFHIIVIIIISPPPAPPPPPAPVPLIEAHSPLQDGTDVQPSKAKSACV